MYFLYYLNLYPVASISERPREYSVEGARRLITEQGHTLVMDRYWTVRYGELAKTYLYLPHVWWKGRPVRPRMLHANALGFTLALLALYAGFWWAGQTAMGAVLVVLLGSNPFQVDSVYAYNNLFGWPITVTALMLGLHIVFMGRRPPRFVAALAVALASGALLGTVRQVRTEPALVMLAVAFVYLTASGLRPWRRLESGRATGGGIRALRRGLDTALREQVRRGLPRRQGRGRPDVRGRAPAPSHFFWHSCGAASGTSTGGTGTCGPTSVRSATLGRSCSEATSRRRASRRTGPITTWTR